MNGATKFILCVLAVPVAIVAVPIAMMWHNHVFDEDYSYTARRDVHLIVDSPEVERLLGEDGANVAEEQLYGSVPKRIEEYVELHQHPERYAPKHIAFLNIIAKQPAEAVPLGSHARALKTSHAHCQRTPVPSSDIYAYFRVTTGPLKNREGWACMSGDFAPTLIWP